MSRRLCAGKFGVYRCSIAVNDAIVDAILHKRCAIVLPVQALYIGFVFREQQFGTAFTVEPATAGVRMLELNYRARRRS